MAVMPIDRHSDTWTTVSKHAEKELQEARERLEAPGMDQGVTEGLRGTIKALKSVLALAEAKPGFK